MPRGGGRAGGRGGQGPPPQPRAPPVPVPREDFNFEEAFQKFKKEACPPFNCFPNAIISASYSHNKHTVPEDCISSIGKQQQAGVQNYYKQYLLLNANNLTLS